MSIQPISDDIGMFLCYTVLIISLSDIRYNHSSQSCTIVLRSSGCGAAPYCSKDTRCGAPGSSGCRDAISGANSEESQQFVGFACDPHRRWTRRCDIHRCQRQLLLLPSCRRWPFTHPSALSSSSIGALHVSGLGLGVSFLGVPFIFSLVCFEFLGLNLSSLALFFLCKT